MKPEKQLYQWDVNQYLTGINPAAQYVDYTIGNEVIRLETDGTRCRIPDEILQTDDEKTCYERYRDGTFRAYSFIVLYAPKPPDYVYTPEERTTFEALTARVDAASEDIKRRADSGEFTPKKGVDYFTDAEKVEMMESVSSGAVGEFREVVNSATAEYNANATEKLTTYDTNAEQHTTDYNRNAEQKLTEYNDNAAEKLNAYNANADNRVAEFNSHSEQIHTDIREIKSDLSAEQTAREQADTSLQQEIAGKLTKSPANWEQWTTDEQAAARERMSAEKALSGNVVFDETITESVYKMIIPVPEGWNNILLRVLYPRTGDEYAGGVNTGSVFATAGRTNNPYDLYVMGSSMKTPTYPGRRLFFDFNLIKRGAYAELNRYIAGITGQENGLDYSVLSSQCAYSYVKVIKFGCDHIPVGTQFILYVD